MLITGLGAYIGKYFKEIKNTHVIVLQILQAILPVVTIFALYIIKNRLFPPGSMINILDIFYCSFAVLLPFCFVSGFLFTSFCNIISELYNDNRISKVYSIESMGSVVGGLLFNLILIYFFRTFQSLVILMFMGFVIAVIHAIILKNRIFIFVILLISSVLSFLLYKYNPDEIAANLLYQKQEILLSKETPYGNIVVTKTEEQFNFYENNIPLYSTNNKIGVEEAVHYAMVQHPKPDNVLVISGEMTGITKEILKYNVKRIDYVEINRWLINISGRYIPEITDKKLNIINKDARLFIKETGNTYDVVLINLPEPVTASINRYYTFEFFSELDKKLSRGAIICTGLPVTMNYISSEAVQTNSVLYETLKKVFKHVLVIPGGKNYFIASDNMLSINIAEKIKEKNIETLYVNEYYLDDTMLKSRSNYIMNSLNTDENINKDFYPVSYYKQIKFWLSYFKDRSHWIIIPALVLLIFAFIILTGKLNTINFGLLTSGFSASSLEILLIVSFQIIYGYVYQALGLIIAFFMLGMALGAFFVHRLIKVNIKNYVMLQLGLGLYAIALPLIFILLRKYSINQTLVLIIFFSVTVDIATIIGAIFSFATKLQNNAIQETAAVSYSYDLAGSALGALAISAFLIPLLGIFNVSFMIGILNLLAGLIILLKKYKQLSL